MLLLWMSRLSTSKGIAQRPVFRCAVCFEYCLDVIVFQLAIALQVFSTIAIASQLYGWQLDLLRPRVFYHKIPYYMQGKVVVVEKWATWCPPCRKTIPHLNKVYQQYKDHESFQLVAVTSETNVKQIRSFMQQHKMQYPVASDTDGKATASYYCRWVGYHYQVAPHHTSV